MEPATQQSTASPPPPPSSSAYPAPPPPPPAGVYPPEDSSSSAVPPKRPFAEMSASGDAEMSAEKRARIENEPSPVAFLRNLPYECTEQDIRALCQPFGTISRILYLSQKHQAFVQMEALDSAVRMVETFQAKAPVLLGRAIYFLFSNRQEISAPLATERDEAPGAILFLTITNVAYPVNVDVLHQVFGRFGVILKIVCFMKRDFQALVQFSDMTAAIQARAAMDNQNIYSGCCTMRIHFSQLSDLQVKYNSERSRDFTNPSLPVRAAPAPMPPAPGMPGMPGMGGMPMGMGMGQQAMYGMAPHGGAAGEPAPGSVLIVNNLNPEYVTNPDVIFTLFGIYGDVQRVKILYNKRESALVQFPDAMQAGMAMQYLNSLPMFGRTITVYVSKMPSVQMPKPGMEMSDAGLTKDYSASPLQRYRTPGSRNMQNVFPPSTNLHVSNLPDDLAEDVIRAEFTRFPGFVGFRRFTNNLRMGIATYGSVEEAVAALISLHNHQFMPGMSTRISFAKPPSG